MLDAANADLVEKGLLPETVTYTRNSAVTVWSGLSRDNAEARIVKLGYTLVGPGGTGNHCAYISFLYSGNGQIGIPRAYPSRHCVTDESDQEHEKFIIHWIANLNFGTATLKAGGDACADANAASLHANVRDHNMQDPSMLQCIRFQAPVPIQIVSNRDIENVTVFEAAFVQGPAAPNIWVTPVDTQ